MWQAKEAIGEAMGADREAQMKADEERMFKAQKVSGLACSCLACEGLRPEKTDVSGRTWTC
jgi:hypothetical protein